MTSDGYGNEPATGMAALDSLTEEQIAECKEMFDLIDKDGDGAITLTDLGNMLSGLGQELSETDLSEFNKSDTSGNGSVDFTEFLAFMARKSSESDTYAQLRESFRASDSDGNALLSRNELRYMKDKLGEYSSDEEIDEILREADTDGDGHIDYEEFEHMNSAKA